jgi:hypothetical protein
MKKLQITFKSGAQVTVDCIELKTERNKLNGQLLSLEWMAPAGWKSKLHTVSVDEVACLVVLS